MTTGDREAARPIVVFSRCLGFAACRYDGAGVVAPAVEALKAHVEARPVCPELEIGLGLPRGPIRLVSAGRRLHLVQPTTGRDLSAAMGAFATAFFDELGLVDGVVLKANSPSCGVRDTKVYRSAKATEPRSRSSGLFAREALSRSRLLPVTTETRLERPAARDRFLTTLFAWARFRAVRASGRSADLVRFHTENKLLLLAHSEEDERALGRLVASGRSPLVASVLTEYEAGLARALARPAGRGGHANALEHALGYVSERLSREERAAFLERLRRFQAGKGNLEALCETMQGWIERFGEPYLARQTYFRPFPEALSRGRPLPQSGKRDSQ